MSERDISSLLIRLAVGPMLVAHGWNKVMGKGGLEGTTKWFEGIGFKNGWLHARLAAATEISSGAMITLGFMSPLPSAAVVGLMTVAMRSDHRGKGFFVFKGGWEYTAVLSAVSTALAMLGPGRFSLDGALGRQRSGIRWGLGAAMFGAANAAAVLASSYRPSEPG